MSMRLHVGHLGNELYRLYQETYDIPDHYTGLQFLSATSTSYSPPRTEITSLSMISSSSLIAWSALNLHSNLRESYPINECQKFYQILVYRTTLLPLDVDYQQVH